MGSTKSGSTEFMLAEYERISALRNNEIAQTEQRFNFFLTVATAAIGVIVVLSQVADLSLQVYSTAMQGLLFILLLFGLTNQNRQNVRSVQLRFYNQQLEKIQDHFAKSDPAIGAYLDWRRNLRKRSVPKHPLMKIILNNLRGTLTNLVILSNSILCGGFVLVTLSADGHPPPTVALWTLVTFVVAMIVLPRYNRFIRKFLTLEV